MNRIRIITFIAMLAACSWAFAQQFTDPGFEDWSGSEFASSIQPKSWHFSNVSQLGVDKNFAHQATGRSGYCLKIQDQFVGVGSIGATSPGYVALGTPWAYVSSLTSINDATAGTYGGIAWSYRPDSMVVWIKREYDSSVDQAAGDHTADENFNIVYYAWTGTAQGASYKAKNGSCNTEVASSKPQYAVDEESDIRMALDRNECGTTTPGTQIAEGSYFAKAAYSTWTKLTIPIYYLSDNAPAKCNVILSAGNYPNFRANDGLYAGNTLYVDDISLIYSSKIQKLFVNGREWKGFDPNNTTSEQIYSLGQGATTIPEIYGVRGAGSLSNAHGTSASFSGRKLTSSECVINRTGASVDGNPVTITVSAEDGSGTSTYTIRFVSQASNNARLADIRVNGSTISGFNAYLTNYNVSLPYGTTAIPTVEADAQDAGASVTITQPTSLNGTATIAVTAADGTTTQTYTLLFSVAALSDNTLQDIQINGTSIPGYSPSKSNYTVELPLGTSSAPTVTWTSAYAAGEQTVTLSSNTLDVSAGTGSATLTVSVLGNSVTKTYRLTYRITASSYSYLADLAIDGATVSGFAPDAFNYYVSLPLGTTILPTISWTQGDAYQTVTKDESSLTGLDGTVRVTVTAASGAQSIYRINFSLEKSTVNTLQSIMLDGVALDGFDPQVTTYTVALPLGTTVAPAITWTAGDTYETITKTDGGLTGTTRISVTSQAGTTRIYQIAFTVATSSDATLQMIYVDGQPLEGFSSGTLEYNVVLPQGTKTQPTVTWQAHDAYQTINTRTTGQATGDYKITVKPQSGTAQTYIIHFSVATSQNTALLSILLDGVPMAGYNADTLHYTDTLPQGVSVLPTVTYEKAESVQRVSSQISGQTVTLTVTAESGDKRVYTLDFIIRKSENAFLKMIYAGGDSLPGFDAQTLNYSITLPNSATVSPLLTVDKADGQTVTIAQPALYGTASITVTPELGASNIYRITFCSADDTTHTEPVTPDPEPLSSDGELAAIYLNGTLLTGFSSEIHQYTGITHASGTSLPTVTYTKKNAHQVVALAATDDEQITLKVMAEDGTLASYVLDFVYQPSTDATLHSLQLDGTALAGFSPATLTYDVNLPAGTTALPAITLTKNEKALTTVSSTATSQIIDVYAEDGTHQTYTIRYTVAPHANALLSSITLDGTPLSGFAPETMNYNYELAWHATGLPEISAVPQTEVKSIVVNYGHTDDATTILVTAEDGTTTATYTILFSSPLSQDANLTDLQVDGADFSFSPTTYTYNITLPYGTTTSPIVSVEKGHQEQRVVITRRSLAEETTVEVTAEDGATKATYHLLYTVTPSAADNVLTGIVVDGIGALDMTTGPNFQISLPYGTKSLDVVSYMKSFPEQTVVINNGGIRNTTTITVSSNRPGESDMVYTLTPKVNEYDPAYLTAITVDGTPIAGFSPTVYNYVVSVSAAPSSVHYVASAGSDVVVTDSTYKSFVAEVENGIYLHKYTVTFYYPGDVTFDCGFENWSSYTNSNVSNGGDGSIPNGWHTPLDAVTSGDKATYYPNANCVQTSEHTQGASAASLASTYLLTSADAMPGFVSLSQPTVTVGYWALGLHDPSTLTFGDPITFRNTPDQIAIDYNLQAYNLMTGWRMNYKANGTNQVAYSGAYASITKNVWQTQTEPITYETGFVPSTLDILVSAGPSDVLSDYYAGVNGAQKKYRYTSTLYIDNLQLLYNSKLASVNVNGDAATLSGTAFTATCGSEYVGTPSLQLVGEVADQGQSVVWADWTGNSRTASIRNFAEDGTYTDYTLTLTRPLSTIDTCSYTLAGMDLQVVAGSPYQTVSISRGDSVFTILVKAEDGGQRTYTVRFLEPTTPNVDTLAAVPFVVSLTPRSEDVTPAVVPSSDTQLSAIRLNGESLADFSPLITDYTLSLADLYSVEIVKGNTEQSAVISISSAPAQGQRRAILRKGNTLQVSIAVTAEDASVATYSLHIKKALSDNVRLADIVLNDVSYAAFHPDTTFYRIVLPCASPKVAQPQIPDMLFQKAEENQQLLLEPAPLGQSSYLTVTAADGNAQRQYELLFIAQQSSLADLQGISVNGEPVSGFLPTTYAYTVNLTSATVDVTYTLGDAFQTVTEIRSGWINNQNIVTLTVQAEDGTMHTYTLTLTAPAPSNDADLSGIYLDGVLIPGFAADIYDYIVSLPKGASLPDVSVRLSDDGATAQMTTSGDEVTIVVTAEDGVTTHTYVVHFDVIRSSEADLQMISVDDVNIAGFSPTTYNYSVDVPVGQRTLPDVTWIKKESVQTVIPATTGNTVTLTVIAEDSTTHVYTLQFTFLLSMIDTLATITADGVELEDYSAQKFSYAYDLPVGTRVFPVLAYEQGDPWQTVYTDTLSSSEWAQSIRFRAVAEAGNEKAYTVTYTILSSEVDTLQAIYLDNQLMEGYSGQQNDYSITLPYGTTALPQVDYVPGDPYQTIDSVWTGNTLNLTVTSESGNTRLYTLTFTVANSDNALLEQISLDGTPLNGFDKEVFSYSYTLPYGTQTMPLVTWITGDEEQTVDTIWTDATHLTINVTAGDQIHTSAYTLTFVFAPSDNAQLADLMLDGAQIAGFAPDIFEYVDTLLYGTTGLPIITWTPGDNEQTVTVTTADDVVTITVIAGDGVTREDYTITYIHLLSPNNFLADLQINGMTIEGFDPDTIEYDLTYPAGTREAQLLTTTDITGIPEDPDAQVSVSEDANHTITVMVTAPNGDVRVYVITQNILLSNEARLSMIYLDSVAMDGFDPDIRRYEFIVAQGTNMPEIYATTIDSTAEVEYGSYSDIETDEYTGKYIEMDGVAEDGTRLTYSILFRYANWAATADADADDYAFIHIKGTNQYKAVTIAIGLQCAVYDMQGRLLQIEELPVADPGCVEVETDESGNQTLTEVYDCAEGMIFTVDHFKETYFYVFFNSKTKRVAKGGKFMLNE